MKNKEGMLEVMIACVNFCKNLMVRRLYLRPMPRLRDWRCSRCFSVSACRAVQDIRVKIIFLGFPVAIAHSDLVLVANFLTLAVFFCLTEEAFPQATSAPPWTCHPRSQIPTTIDPSFAHHTTSPCASFLHAGSQTMGDNGRIWNWLKSVPTYPREGHRDQSFDRPHKRAKLNNGRACHQKEDDDGHDDQGGSGDFALVQTDLTLRPLRPLTCHNDREIDSPSAAPIRSSASRLSSPSKTSSSNVSKVSRNSSPTKQFRNASIQETGFSRASFDDDQPPKSLDALAQSLRRINEGCGILPKGLRGDVRTISYVMHQLPGYPPLQWIAYLLTECQARR